MWHSTPHGISQVFVTRESVVVVVVAASLARLVGKQQQGSWNAMVPQAKWTVLTVVVLHAQHQWIGQSQHPCLVVP
jgi:hypothetical protein